MGRSRSDVGGYRGRRTVTDFLRIIAVILGVMVVLALAGVLYLQQYIVYTPDGPKLELPPFLQAMRRGDGPEDPEGSASLPGPGDVSAEEPDIVRPDPEPDPEPEPPGYALKLPVSDVTGGTAAARLEQAGADILVVEMKGQSGKLAWNSGQELARQSHVNGQQAVNDAMAQWNAGEVYTVAQVCCFRDDSVPYYNNKLALRRGNYNWRDELGLRWLSPAQDRNQAYIAALCGELAAMGFDEILLEQFSFPTGGKLENIARGESYDPAQFAAEMESLLAQVEQAVEPYGAKISLRVERDTLAGTESVSGLSPQLLERYAFRLWTQEDGQLPAPLDLLAQAGITGEADRLVEIRQARAQDSDVTQAVLTGQG